MDTLNVLLAIDKAHMALQWVIAADMAKLD